MVEKICKNCALFDRINSVCGVTIIHEGEYKELIVSPNSSCYWEKISKDIGFNVIDEIKQVRIWKEGEDTKIEYPDLNQSNPL